MGWHSLKFSELTESEFYQGFSGACLPNLGWENLKLYMIQFYAVGYKDKNLLLGSCLELFRLFRVALKFTQSKFALIQLQVMK